MKKNQVTLLPAHPDEGYLSMNRYWDLACKSLLNRPEISVKSLLAPEYAQMEGGAGKIKKSISKYLTYPMLVRNSKLGDIVHILDHSSAHLLQYVPKNVKTVVTVHDIIPFYDNQGLTKSQVKRFHKVLKNLHHADLLIAVSEYTKEDLVKHLNIPPQKIVVSLEGVDTEYFSRVGKEVELPIEIKPDQKMIFSLGGNDCRKNLKIFPAVMKELKDNGHNILFVRAGAMMDDQLASQLKNLLGKNFIEMGRVSEDQLVTLYNQADVVVIPSFYEGFGLPVLEGMAAGVPVVASNQSSLPEVGLDAALYFSPNDAHQAAAQISKVFENTSLRENLITLGKARVKELSWKRHFDEVVELYSNL